MTRGPKITSVRKVNKILWSGISVGIKVLLLVVACVLFIVVTTSCYQLGYRAFAGEAVSAPPGKDVTFMVSQGESTGEILDNLKRAGVIEDALSCRIVILFYGCTLKPGIYTLNTSMTNKQIVQTLAAGVPETESGGS